MARHLEGEHAVAWRPHQAGYDFWVEGEIGALRALLRRGFVWATLVAAGS